MKNPICFIPFVLLALLPFAGESRAGETPETILIRQSLSNDISGYRRADAELALSAYDERFVAYRGHANGDPRAWTILHENRDALQSQMATDLQARRYEVNRTVPFIAVRTTHAIATSIDSGQVVDRQSGAATPVQIQRLWILRKTEDDWLATAMVANLGDSLLPAAPGTNGDIAELLQRESQAWEEGSTAGILGLFDEHFTGYDARATFKPATWKIAFSGAEEMEKWLDKRLPYVQYDLDRQLLHAAVSGDEALAVTHETVAISHTKGPAKHQKERYILWTISRHSGAWKITNMLYDLGLTD